MGKRQVDSIDYAKLFELCYTDLFKKACGALNDIEQAESAVDSIRRDVLREAQQKGIGAKSFKRLALRKVGEYCKGRAESRADYQSIPTQLRGMMGGARPYPRDDNGETERRLIEAAQHGDKSAFNELMKHYLVRMYFVAQGVLKNDCTLAPYVTEAEDALQEALIRLVVTRTKRQGKPDRWKLDYARIRTFRGNSKFSTWLHVIAERAAFNWFRDEWTTEKDNRITDLSYSFIEDVAEEINALDSGGSDSQTSKEFAAQKTEDELAEDRWLAAHSAKSIDNEITVSPAVMLKCVRDPGGSAENAALANEYTNEQGAALERALDHLPKHQADDYRRYHGGEKVKEIAQTSHRKESAVYKSIERARETLTVLLRPFAERRVLGDFEIERPARKAKRRKPRQETRERPNYSKVTTTTHVLFGNRSPAVIELQEEIKQLNEYARREHYLKIAGGLRPGAGWGMEYLEECWKGDKLPRWITRARE